MARQSGIRTPGAVAARSSRIRKRRAAAPRAPGRPRLGQDQRTRLLDAALACYVRQGIRGTSIRDIAAEAGVTSALVHYYFGDAGSLQQQVVQERLMPVFNAVRSSLQSEHDDPAALVASFATAICAAIDANPWWPALWVREVISEGGSLRDLLLQRVMPEFIRGLARQLGAAQARGRLNPKVDPRLLVVSVIGLTLFPAAGAPIWRQVLGAEDLTLEDIRSHALALLTDGLKVKR